MKLLVALMTLLVLTCRADVPDGKWDAEAGTWSEQEQQDQFLDKEDTIHIPYYDNDWLIPETDQDELQESELWSDIGPREIEEQETIYDESNNPYPNFCPDIP